LKDKPVLEIKVNAGRKSTERVPWGIVASYKLKSFVGFVENVVLHLFFEKERHR